MLLYTLIAVFLHDGIAFCVVKLFSEKDIGDCWFFYIKIKMKIFGITWWNACNCKLLIEDEIVFCVVRKKEEGIVYFF